MDNVESYFESKDESLWNYLESTTYHMGLEDEDYQEILDDIEKIFDEHPNLREVFENDNVMDLSVEDAKALQELQVQYLNKRDIDMRNSFYLGGRNLYYYLKQMRIID